MDNVEMYEIARGNIERHLGDCESDDDLYDNAYVLAFDALVDRGVDHKQAREVAQDIARCYVQE